MNFTIPVLYTHQKNKKSKVWQDGYLKIETNGTKVTLNSSCGMYLDNFNITNKKFEAGDEFESDKYLISVTSERYVAEQNLDDCKVHALPRTKVKFRPPFKTSLQKPQSFTQDDKTKETFTTEGKKTINSEKKFSSFHALYKEIGRNQSESDFHGRSIKTDTLEFKKEKNACENENSRLMNDVVHENDSKVKKHSVDEIYQMLLKYSSEKKNFAPPTDDGSSDARTGKLDSDCKQFSSNEEKDENDEKRTLENSAFKVQEETDANVLIDFPKLNFDPF